MKILRFRVNLDGKQSERQCAQALNQFLASVYITNQRKDKKITDL
jgi:hypothetical protein